MASLLSHPAFRDEAVGRFGAAGRETLATLTRSKLGLNGAALAVAGFFGCLNVVNPADAIISFYVLLGGVVLIGFALGAGYDFLKCYFGFMYDPNGQLHFLLVVGNLAWACGLFGMLAALFSNMNAFVGWYTQMEQPGAAGVPGWVHHIVPAGLIRQGGRKPPPAGLGGTCMGGAQPHMDHPGVL